MFYAKHRGITLLEILLVLAVGSAILLIGFNQYQVSKKQADMEELKANVDILFQSLTNYYRANCGDSITPHLNKTTNQVTNTLARGGDFSPSTITSSYPPDTFAVDIQTKLINNGFLHQWHPSNALVDNSSGTGYITQLNSVTVPMNVYTCWTGNTGGVYYTGCQPSQSIVDTGNNPILSVVVWQEQVAVHIVNATPEIMQAYQASLGADCISSATSSTNVTPCASLAPGSSGDYLVWTRLPSFASHNTSSTVWPSMPLSKQFNLQYTHDQMYELNNPSYATTQYYLCGS